MTCPKCNSVGVTATVVDERNMLRCLRCWHQWYTARGWSNGIYSILDEIAEDVTSKGVSECLGVVLLNCVWRDDFAGGLKAWADSHGFKIVVESRKQDGKMLEWVVFTQVLPPKDSL